MKPVNSFEISAFIATEPEVRKLANSTVARFALSVAQTEKTPDGDKRTSALINVEAWRKNDAQNADFAELRKGTLALVKGFIKPEEWSKDGKKYSRIVFLATSAEPVAKPE